MLLYPAIDIRGGRAVRLRQGDYDRETIFDDDPLAAARRWVDAGARALHVVDLDGAREGRPVNLEHVARIVSAAGVPVQVGGGIRSAGAASEVLAAGADRVVLGTALQRDPQLAAELTASFGERIVAGVDTRAGRVAVEGWTEGTETPAAELVSRLCDLGVSRFVFTPVEVDGMLAGPGVEQLREIAPAVNGELVYSGGVGSLDDLRELSATGIGSLAGVIVGRALYDELFTVAEAQGVLDGRES